MRHIAVLSFALLLACGNGHEGHDHDHDAEPREEEHAHGHTHADDALYGGKMVEIGDHAAWVEIVHSPVSGMIEAYVRDAHAENPLPSAMSHLPLLVRAGGNEHEVRLLPHIDPLSSEEEGAVSVFRATVPALEGVKTFEGVLGPLELKGAKFPPAAFTYEPR